MRRAGTARAEATRAARNRCRASETALSGKPTTLKAGRPGATWTCTSTARASIPSKATVVTRETMPAPVCAAKAYRKAFNPARTFREQMERRRSPRPLGFNPVPDHGRDIRTAEILHRPDARRGGDIDFRQITVNHIDADKQQAAAAQSRPQPQTDFTLAFRQLGLGRRTATHHVGAKVVRRRHPIDGTGEFAIHQNDALVSLAHGGKEFLHHPLLTKCRAEQIVKGAKIEILLGEAKHRLAALAVKRFHDNVAMLGAKT